MCNICGIVPNLIKAEWPIQSIFLKIWIPTACTEVFLLFYHNYQQLFFFNLQRNMSFHMFILTFIVVEWPRQVSSCYQLSPHQPHLTLPCSLDRKRKKNTLLTCHVTETLTGKSTICCKVQNTQESFNKYLIVSLQKTSHKWGHIFL